MNTYKKYTCMLGLAIAALTSACDDPDAELTSIDYDRLFSPINLEARVTNRTNVRLSWSEVKGASSYNIEVFENDSLTFAGSPVRTISDVTAADLPYTISKLEGDMKYSARVQAVGENISESKWSGVYFKTDTEQIFETIGEDDLEATTATLRWTAGEAATEIVLTKENETDEIIHQVTADEIAAGAATVTGLTGETTYTAKLMNGTKVRGTLTFTTLLDLGNAIAVTPEDDFAEVLANAKDGDSFALYPGTYSVKETTDGVESIAKMVISKSIELKAVRPNDRPVLNGSITLNDGASLLLRQIVMDGTGTDGSQAIVFNTADAAYSSLTIEDCEIKNYTKGVYYLNVAATVDEITINNSLVHDIECSGGDMLDSRKGAIKALTLSNSTFYNSCAERDFVRYDDASSAFAGITPTITVTHCTLVGISNSASKRLMYVRFKGNQIVFKNNLIASTAALFSNQAKTDASPEFGKNNYFDAPTAGSIITGSGDTATLVVEDKDATTLNPGFKDAANGDFTLSHEDLIYNQVGDPRWY